MKLFMDPLSSFSVHCLDDVFPHLWPQWIPSPRIRHFHNHYLDSLAVDYNNCILLASASASASVGGIVDCMVIVLETRLGIVECTRALASDMSVLAFDMAAWAFGMVALAYGMLVLALGIAECN